MVTLERCPLMKWGKQAFALFRPDAKDKADLSDAVATTVGAHAARLGWSEKELREWSQSAYSGLFVRETALNPGLDHKDVQKALIKGYRKWKET